MPGAVRVTLKLATSLDGRIAMASGESKWITGEAARLEGHRLRASHDAILVGVKTVLADDPELTVRLLPIREADGEVDRAQSDRDGGGGSDSSDFAPGTGTAGAAPSVSPANRGRATSPSGEPMGRRQPLRVVLDSRLRTPSTARVVGEHTLILTAADPGPVGGAQVEQVAAADGRPAVPAILDALARHGCRSALIEGGGQVAASFLKADAVDAIEWFRAPILLGGEGRPCVAGLALAKLAQAPKFRRLSAEPVGDDLWERYAAIR